MERLLDNPTTCPHGNPIPGSRYVEPDMVSLSSVAVGAGFRVTRIPEQLEFADGMLEFLESNGLVPGNAGRVLAKSPDGTVTVQVGEVVVGVGAFAAERILAQS
jgi:DtxR family Mn-dependent transcriptional regulator